MVSRGFFQGMVKFIKMYSFILKGCLTLAGVLNNEPIRNFLTLIIHMSMCIRNNMSRNMGLLIYCTYRYVYISSTHKANLDKTRTIIHQIHLTVRAEMAQFQCDQVFPEAKLPNLAKNYYIITPSPPSPLNGENKVITNFIK